MDGSADTKPTSKSLTRDIIEAKPPPQQLHHKYDADSGESDNIQDVVESYHRR